MNPDTLNNILNRLIFMNIRITDLEKELKALRIELDEGKTPEKYPRYTLPCE